MDIDDIYDLSDHPEYAQLIGQIFAVWTAVEFRLCHIFSLLLRSPPWLADAAFYSLYNNRGRIDMIRAMAKRLKESNPDRHRILDLMCEVNDAPAARHGYAHKPWLHWKGKVYQMDETALTLKDTKRHHVSKTQLEKDLKALKKLSWDLKEFIRDYSSRNPLTIQVTPDDGPWLDKALGRPPRRGP